MHVADLVPSCFTHILVGAVCGSRRLRRTLVALVRKTGRQLSFRMERTRRRQQRCLSHEHQRKLLSSAPVEALKGSPLSFVVSGTCTLVLYVAHCPYQVFAATLQSPFTGASPCRPSGCHIGRMRRFVWHIIYLVGRLPGLPHGSLHCLPHGSHHGLPQGSHCTFLPSGRLTFFNVVLGARAAD